MAGIHAKKAKKLPKRTGKPAHAARRAASWARGEVKKAERRKVQEAAHARNLVTGTTPRAERRKAKQAANR